MKPSFLGHEKPLLTAMVYEVTPQSAKVSMRNAIFDRADAFAIDLCVMPIEYHDEKTLRSVFAVADGRPIYTYYYRKKTGPRVSEDTLAETAEICIRAGATLCDLTGDLYEPDAPRQLAVSPDAVDKQMRLIDRIHGLGGEVLMSSHIHSFVSLEETLRQAKEIEKRGADVVKIVVSASSRAEEDEVFRTTMALREELKKPFLHLCMGPYGKLHRVLTPFFGSCMTLCVQSYNLHTSVFEQPLLRATRAVYDNIDAGK